METNGISPSSFNVFNHCEQQFFLEQALRQRFPSSWKATDHGVISHAILELLALVRLSRLNDSPVIQMNELGEYNDKNELIEGTNVWTIPDDFETNLYAYLKPLCEQIYHHYTTRVATHHNWEEEDFKKIKKYVHTAITHSNGIWNPLNLNIIGAEQRFDLELPNCSTAFTIRGVMDLVFHIDKNTVGVCDWKSGKRADFHSGKKKEYEDFLEDIQLCTYHWALCKLYPEYDYSEITIFYLKDGGPYTIFMDRSSLDKIEQRLYNRYEEIKAVEIPKLNKSEPWRCQKFCPFATHSFTKPLTEFRYGQFTKAGKPMSMCQEIEYVVKEHGLEWVTKNYAKPKEEKK